MSVSNSYWESLSLKYILKKIYCRIVIDRIIVLSLQGRNSNSLPVNEPGTNVNRMAQPNFIVQLGFRSKSFERSTFIIQLSFTITRIDQNFIKDA